MCERSTVPWYQHFEAQGILVSGSWCTHSPHGNEFLVPRQPPYSPF